MPPLTYKLQNGTIVAAHDLLLAEVHDAVFKGGRIPDRPLATAKICELVPPDMPQPAVSAAPRQLSNAYLDPAQQALARNAQSGALKQGVAIAAAEAQAAIAYRGRQLTRSKRKVAVTLVGGTMVGPVVTGLVGAALLSNPVGWAILGAAGTAVATTAAAYLAMRGLRGARAAYFDAYALKPFLETLQSGGDMNAISNDTANGVRYWLQKRKVSVIADDIRDLGQAWLQLQSARGNPLRNCHECMKLAEAFETVSLLSAKLQYDLDAFIKFYEWMRAQAKRIFFQGDNAFTEERVAATLRECHEFVSDTSTRRHEICGRFTQDGFKKCCYRATVYPGVGDNDWDIKLANPVVTVFQTLTNEQRRPFIRLTNDAAYNSVAGEDIQLKMYRDFQDHLRDVLPEVAMRAYQKLRNEWRPARSEAPPAQPREAWAELPGRDRGRAAAEDQFDAHRRRRDIEQSDYENAVKQGAIKGGITGAVGVPGSVAMHATRDYLGGSVQGALVDTAKTGASGAAVGVGTAIVRKVADARNFENEMTRLCEQIQVKKAGGQMDTDTVVVALRTILKDGGFFEKAVDELAKLRTYYDEFTLASTGIGLPGGCCSIHYERVYRCIKALKHVQKFLVYFDNVQMFAEQATQMRQRTSEQALEPIQREIAERIRAAMENSIDHNMKCDTYCYASRDQEVAFDAI